MEFTFLGGASEVGASCTLFQVAGQRILIDGGMRPAAKEGQSRIPDLALLDSYPPDVLLITHAHIDHTGALPLIASLFPDIAIFATESTRVLTEILLRDSVQIMEQEGLKPDGEMILYDIGQVNSFLERIRPANFAQPFAPISSEPGITVRFLPAGHILGAAMLYFATPEGTVLYTGDISITEQRTIKGLDMNALPQADVMICEGTYGNRTHTNRKEEERKLVETVQATIARGGRVLCPAFAVGRAQEVILILKSYRASGQVSPAPIYLDGMVRSVCTAYQAQSHDLRPSLQRYQQNSRRPLFSDPDLQIFGVRNRDRNALVSTHAPMMVISSSGMLSGGASPLYAIEMSGREEDCVLFTGYQDEESPGAALLQAKQGDTLQLGKQSYTLACQIAHYKLSGHANADQIVHAVSKVNPKHLILVHGNPESLEELARRISKIRVDIPTVGSCITSSVRSSAVAGVELVATEREKIATADQKPIMRERPTIQGLWALAIQIGPLRPWTAVELGQQYYGREYHPSQRSQIELILKEATPYFRQGRLGVQPTYLPRTQKETEHLRPLSQLTGGEIVLAQGHKGMPQIALLLAEPHEGKVLLISDQWKQGIRPINLLQLTPNVRREEWLKLTPVEVKLHLQTWKIQLEHAWVDLIAWWDQCQGESITFAALCERQPTEDLRLAWGLELLTHGHELFQRSGPVFTPCERSRVASKGGFTHHLALVHAGAGTLVRVNERWGRLTGRSNWRTFEVCWAAGEEAGTYGRVRGSNIQLESE